MSAYSSQGANKVKAAMKLADADKEVGYFFGGSDDNSLFVFGNRLPESCPLDSPFQ